MRAIAAAIRDGRLNAELAVLVSNNRNCGAIQWAAQNGVPWRHLSRQVIGSEVQLDATIAKVFKAAKVDLIVLAGYMRMLGPVTIAAFPNRILNVHPALLPKHGGQGMYGKHVHEAVLAAGDTQTGATIHLVDGEYDHGATVAQIKVPVVPGDTVETLTAKVQAREQELFPETLRRIFAGEINLDRL